MHPSVLVDVAVYGTHRRREDLASAPLGSATEVPDEIVAHLQHANKHAAGTVKLRLVEVIGRRGKQQAVFEVSGDGESLSADSMGLNRVHAIFDGEAVIEVETGRLVRLTSVGPIRGTMTDSDGRARVRGTMKFEYEVRYL